MDQRGHSHVHAIAENAFRVTVTRVEPVVRPGKLKATNNAAIPAFAVVERQIHKGVGDSFAARASIPPDLSTLPTNRPADPQSVFEHMLWSDQNRSFLCINGPPIQARLSQPWSFFVVLGRLKDCWIGLVIYWTRSQDYHHPRGKVEAVRLY